MRILLAICLLLSMMRADAQELRFKNHMPKWMHAIQCNECPDTLFMKYYPYQSKGRHFIRYKDNQVIMPSNIQNVWGYNILSLDMETGEQQWQVTERYDHDSLGHRRMIDVPVILGDTLVVPMYQENGYKSDRLQWWYRGNVGVEKYDVHTGERLDSLIVDAEDSLTLEVNNPIYSQYNIDGFFFAQTYYDKGHLEYIWSLTEKLERPKMYRKFIKHTLTSDGRHLFSTDTLRRFYDQGYYTVNVFNVGEGKFATFSQYRNREVAEGFDFDHRLEFYDKDLNLLREVNTDHFLEDDSKLIYMDSTQSIYRTRPSELRDTFINRYVHVMEDSIVKEKTDYVENAYFVKAMPYKGNMLIALKVANDPENETFNFYRTDGSGHLEQVFSLELDRDVSEHAVYAYLRDMYLMPSGDLFLLMKIQEHYGGNLADFGPPHEYLVCIAGEELKTDDVAVVDGSKQVYVYPNPSIDIIKIQSQELIERVGVYDMSGRRYVRTIIDRDHIEVSDLAAGTYILEILYKDGNRLTRKFVKQ